MRFHEELRHCSNSKILAFSSSVCKAAKADLAFLVDGSWSIGDDNFNKIINFLYSTVGALDKIGPDGTQVINTCRDGGCMDLTEYFRLDQQLNESRSN